MKLVDLVKYLQNEDAYKALYTSSLLNRDSDDGIGIYLKDSRDINSDLFLFGEEITGDRINYIQDGIKYVQLFPLSLAMDLMDQLDLRGKNLNEQEIAQRLLEYSINDA